MSLKHIAASTNLRNKFFILLLCLIFNAVAMAQPTKLEDKLDPAFRQLIVENNPNDSSVYPKSCSSNSKVKPAGGGVSGNKPVEKMYGCIVYTKNAQALKDIGIMVQSVLPTFVTARVTVAQMLQMAAMPVVTYIEAPHTGFTPTQQNSRQN